MANYNIKLDLSKLIGVELKEMNGQSFACIPVKDNLFVSAKTNAIYLDAVAYELDEEYYGQSHSIKQKVGTDRYKAMTVEQRRSIPKLGSLSPVVKNTNNQPNSSNNGNMPSNGTQNINSIEDLPF